jgi:hypothetical protein
MFKTISWQEFTVAVSVAAACYYAFIAVVFYRRDIAAKLRGEPTSATATKSIPRQKPSSNFMGAISTTSPVRKKPVAESSASAEEVEVAQVPASSLEQEHSTPGGELLQELRNLFEIMKEGKPSQDAYLKNIKTLFAQYVHLIGLEEFTRISITIIEELKTRHDIFISMEMMEELWPKEKVKHSNHSK